MTRTNSKRRTIAPMIAERVEMFDNNSPQHSSSSPLRRMSSCSDIPIGPIGTTAHTSSMFDKISSPTTAAKAPPVEPSQECLICYENISGEHQAALPGNMLPVCKHDAHFHKACLEKSLQRNKNCPECREPNDVKTAKEEPR